MTSEGLCVSSALAANFKAHAKVAKSAQIYHNICAKERFSLTNNDYSPFHHEFMALYSYRKSFEEPASEAQDHDPDLITITPPPSPDDRLTLGKLFSGILNDLNRLLAESKVAGFIIPFLLIVFGLNIIFRQVWPEIEQQIKMASGFYNGETVALVEGEYIERSKYLSNPGSDYFKKINESAAQKHILQPDPISNKYSGRFSISIPSLELNDLAVSANVDSSTEASYQQALKSALAHFKGTGLPVSDVNNNIVIYGHSSSGDYYERTRDIAGAFSRLNKIKIGDLVTIKMDGKSFLYRITKTRIVEPDETEIITGITNKRTLTLFTCFPNGNSAQRFVAIGNPVE